MMGNLQRSRNKLMTWTLLLYLASQVCCQQCDGPCQCPSVPSCPQGVPLILDGCKCCRVCARQQGEACTNRFLCDSQRGLQCDYSASFPGGPGECVSQKEMGCELNGVSYQEGQVFQPSCALQCRCSGGGVTCVPQCREDVLLPTPDCPHPRRVQPPGKCCKEWVCENMNNTVLEDARIASRTDQLVPANLGLYQTRPSFNCIDQSSEWSACSQTCGPGKSTRVSNQNPACRLEMQIRLCTIRPCQHVLHRTPQGSRKCQPSYRSARPVRLIHQGCYSTRFYRPRYCGLCTDKRCCTPHHTSTTTVTFRCPRGRMIRQAVMTINSCVCHHNCPYSSVGTYRGTSFWG